jgi:AraC family transcriptional regulator
MDALSGLNQVMQYIECNLDGEIDPGRVAQIAGCSVFHFSRMFAYIAGIPLSEYIRRRRLSAAAMELQTAKSKVTDIAMKYGYESPTAFNRAFQNMHGIAPSKACNEGIRLKTYPVMSFHLSIKGDVPMDYKIIEMKELTVAGIKKTMKLVNGDEDFSGIMQMWSALTEDDAERIMPLSDGAINGLIGVSANNDGHSFDYYIGCTTEEASVPGMEALRIPAAAWAVFEAAGALPDSVIDTWKRIFAEWFPSSGYESLPLPTIEVYSDGDSGSDDYHSELWVPVAKMKR